MLSIEKHCVSVVREYTRCTLSASRKSANFKQTASIWQKIVENSRHAFVVYDIVSRINLKYRMFIVESYKTKLFVRQSVEAFPRLPEANAYKFECIITFVKHITHTHTHNHIIHRSIVCLTRWNQNFPYFSRNIVYVYYI